MYVTVLGTTKYKELGPYVANRRQSTRLSMNKLTIPSRVHFQLELRDLMDSDTDIPLSNYGAHQVLILLFLQKTSTKFEESNLPIDVTMDRHGVTMHY